jgi:hypothetical protein
VTEQLLRDYAEAGKFVHLSVYARWGAHNSPTVFHASFITPWGQGHSDNVDPVAAITEAVNNAPKERQRHTPVVHHKSSHQEGHIAPGARINPGEDVPLAPAPVRGQPVAPAKAKDNNRKTPQGQDRGSVAVPNLMELFK